MKSSRDEEPWVGRWLERVPDLVEQTLRTGRESLENHLVIRLGRSIDDLTHNPDLIGELLHNSDPGVRACAIEFLTFFRPGDNGYLDAIRRLSASDPAPMVRERAISHLTYACLQGHSDDIKKGLANICRDRNQPGHVRVAAYAGLLQIDEWSTRKTSQKNHIFEHNNVYMAFLRGRSADDLIELNRIANLVSEGEADLSEEKGA